MNNADLFSILINLAVGIYFAIYYPRSLQKRMGDNPPRGFALLKKIIPPIGWLIIIITLIYAVTLLISK